MPLPGQRLGPYEIESALGAGGMGEVYRARDTRLGRIVAIKVLSVHLAHTPELRERFEREARAVANLHHPHLCTLYDVGREGDTDYIVIEYLEGQTLAERLTKGRLPLSRALIIGAQIADALDAAHRQGITHRDLKPANIMLTKSGAKLLDFGLAKLKPAVDGGATTLPTVGGTSAEGMLVGTIQYMAPEQLEGKPADARTDIYALGAVIHEMVTGKRVFDGIVPLTPPALDRIVTLCLAKDPDDRWQSARDLAAELRWIADGDASTASIPADSTTGRTLMIASTALFAGAGVVALAAWTLVSAAPAPASIPTTRMVITLPAADTFPTTQTLGGAGIALSPAGDRLAYVALHAGVQQLFVRDMDSLDTRALQGTIGATEPVFAPDGQTIAFFADGKLKKIPAAGGPVTTVTNAQGYGAAAWDGDTIYFVDAPGGSLAQVSAKGGEPHVVRDSADGGAFAPTIVNGRGIAYAISPGAYGGGRIMARSIGDTTEHEIVANATFPRYIGSGYLVYWRNGGLFAAPFDASTLRPAGGEVLVVDDVILGGFSVSRTGSLAYVNGAPGSPRRLVWVDRSGVRAPLDAPIRPYDAPRISPDGRKVAIEVGSQAWIYDLDRRSLTRLAFEGTTNDGPIWSADGKRIAVRSDRAGVNRVFWQLADGSGGAEPLTDGNIGQLPRSFSPDGQWLAFQEVGQETRRNIWLLQMATLTKRPFLDTRATEGAASFSPDGHWIAYVSDESGKPEVYVQPFQASGGKWQVSTEGGTEPVWNRNGRELFFRSGDRMMAVDVSTEPIFSSGRPRMLFQGNYVQSEFPLTGFGYDVSPDGQRFLMIEETGGPNPPQINVVLNWVGELKRRVPVQR